MKQIDSLSKNYCKVKSLIMYIHINDDELIKKTIIEISIHNLYF